MVKCFDKITIQRRVSGVRSCVRAARSKMVGPTSMGRDNRRGGGWLALVC